VNGLETAPYYSTAEEYLAAEERSEQKHEYLAGVIYAMAGTTIEHERIAMNIIRALGDQLRGQPCEVFSSKVKVRVQTGFAEFCYYPDATVDCGTARGESLWAAEPRVIFEVLSPSTERIDRGEKLRDYQALPSLEAYAIVDQSRHAVTLYRRQDPSWKMELFTETDAIVSLPSIGCVLTLASIYERTALWR
jgi:Uma2 family endonuclease